MPKIRSSNIPRSSVYAIVRRLRNDYYYDIESKVFMDDPNNPYIGLMEDPYIFGFYEIDIDDNWEDGTYIVTVYKQKGDSPRPVVDGKPNVNEFFCKGNCLYPAFPPLL